jgi:hypothetical protein
MAGLISSPLDPDREDLYGTAESLYSSNNID